MCGIPKYPNEKLLVGFESSDDACVYKVSEEIAIVSTVDFFPPIVDDPYTFGLIAASNSLSDVYAMGGYPTHAVNVFCFPTCLDISVAKEILAGGAAKCREANCCVAGGHSIMDKEPKFGLSVSGIVHPQKIQPNNAARPGDRIVMTKRIGSGVLTTAMKGGELPMEKMGECIECMAMLNKYAAEAANGLRIHSCTDITGFGLGGHLCEMAEGSGVTAKLYSERIPLLTHAYDMAKEGLAPAGTYRNLEHFGDRIKLADSITDEMSDLIFDPQTSGGLLFAVDEGDADELLKRLEDAGVPAADIAEVQAYDGEANIQVI